MRLRHADHWIGVLIVLSVVLFVGVVLEAGFLRGLQRLRDRDSAFVATIFVDQMDFADADLLVDARTVFAGRLWRSHRAANGSGLLCCCNDSDR